VTASEPGEGKKSINNKKNDNTDENKDGGTKGGIKKGIDKGIGRGPLFKKKKDLLYHFF